MSDSYNRFRKLEIVLWVIAGVLAAVLALSAAPSLLGRLETSDDPTETVLATPVATPSRTLTLTPTPVRSVSAATERGIAPLPTPPAGAQVLEFAADFRKSGWIVSGDANPHLGDRNLHAGTYSKQAYSSVVYFELVGLAPGSQILYAEVDLAGLSRTYLGTQGIWSLKMLAPKVTAGWTKYSSGEFREAALVGGVGTSVTPADLLEGRINQFVLSDQQRSQLESAVNESGSIGFRMDGPGGPDQSLFTWDNADPTSPSGAHPMLRVIAIPAQFVFITNTPTPQNVMTAAAAVVRSTEQAQQYGTPTLFPRQFATIPPDVIVTPRPTPANAETATAWAEYATAVAVTTGTFTPTPLNFVTAGPTWTLTPTPTSTPTRSYLTLGEYTPVASRTPLPREIPIPEYRLTPIPPDSGLIGKIVYVTTRGGGVTDEYWVMDSNGAPAGKLSGPLYHQIAAVHDLFSPDYSMHLDFDKDGRGLWQIVLFDISKNLFTPLISEDNRSPGIGVYHPSWSPAGDKIAFVSERTGNSEIYVFDLTTRKTTRLTDTKPEPVTGDWWSNKHPSWSPDGKQIVFGTNRGMIGRWQIWVMQADGSGQHNLSPSSYSDWDPVWIKR